MPRIIEGFLALFLILILSPLLIICWIVCVVDTESSGLFMQDRVGQGAQLFKIYKFKTMVSYKVTSSGSFLRKYKLDELPQLFNILKGDMSFVGPRPDIMGYYDQLSGDSRKILDLKPGLTSLAAIKYRNEEHILTKKENPLVYNDSVIFPDKVKLNLDYYYKRSFRNDLKIMFQTLQVMIFKSKLNGV